MIQDHYGDVLFKLGRYDEAIAAWTRALAGDGDSIDRGRHRQEDQDREAEAPQEMSAAPVACLVLVARGCSGRVLRRAADEAAGRPRRARAPTPPTRSRRRPPRAAASARSRRKSPSADRSAASAFARACSVGVAAPASARLEAVAPFGPPLFIFAATDDDATLLLPRDERVLEHGRPAEVLDAVAGVPLERRRPARDADRLRAGAPEPAAARSSAPTGAS